MPSRQGSSAEEDDEEHEAHFQELVNLTHTDAELKVAAHKKKMEVDTEIEEDAYDDKVEEIVDMLEDLRPHARVALATDEGATKQEIQMAEDEEDPLEGLAKLILRLRDGDDARSPPPSGAGRPNRFQADSDDDVRMFFLIAACTNGFADTCCLSTGHLAVQLSSCLCID